MKELCMVISKRNFPPLCLIFFVLLGIMSSSCQSLSDKPTYANALIDETSPYLLQHAYNPVDWHAWNEQTLQKAKKENKMIIISIGYAACHWCHVMEHESFEDTTVSRLMNEHFISIKVDREERPDIDDVYMTACQMASQQGCGWPLNAFALPDGRPVWAGTYFPKKNWLDILQYFVETYQTEKDKLEEYAQKITEGIQSMDELPIIADSAAFNQEVIQQTAKTVIGEMDLQLGGRKGAPKFPMPVIQSFLLSYDQQFKDPAAAKVVETTLNNMAKGGIFDQLGGGFARYSTDDKWLVPHFEKMLYDNAQLLSIYAQAYLRNANPLFKQTIEATVAFLERELHAPNGGYFSSLDADSEGEEGKFYVWETSNIDAIFPEEQTRKLVKAYYGIKPKGNWEGVNILTQATTAEQLANQLQLETNQVKSQLISAQKKLLEERQKRIRPGLDDKQLTSWNALLISGLVDAHRALPQNDYRTEALAIGQFIVDQMLEEDGRLWRNHKEGKSTINGFLDDYANTAKAFIGLYSITFDEAWLFRTQKIVDYAMAHFQDGDSPLFNYTSDLDPPLIARKKEIADNVIPASNSLMAHVLFDLGNYLSHQEYLDRAHAMLATVQSQFLGQETPSYYSNWCRLYLNMLQPPFEVAIVGPDFEGKREKLMANYLPNTLFLGGANEGKLPLLQDKLQEGETYIYVCQNKVCQLPVTEPEAALKQLIQSK